MPDPNPLAQLIPAILIAVLDSSVRHKIRGLASSSSSLAHISVLTLRPFCGPLCPWSPCYVLLIHSRRSSQPLQIFCCSLQMHVKRSLCGVLCSPAIMMPNLPASSSMSYPHAPGLKSSCTCNQGLPNPMPMPAITPCTISVETGQRNTRSRRLVSNLSSARTRDRAASVVEVQVRDRDYPAAALEDCILPAWSALTRSVITSTMEAHKQKALRLRKSRIDNTFIFSVAQNLDFVSLVEAFDDGCPAYQNR